MPGNLMQYSGLITKTRAMSGKLLDENELRQITELSTVNEVVNYLKGTKSYGAMFQGRDEVWHRGMAEEVLANAMFQDFAKLYRFANANQRVAFRYVLFRHEVDILKYYLQVLFHEQPSARMVYVDDFFAKHVCFSLEQIKKASNLQEMIQALAGTPYEKVISGIQNGQNNQYAKWAVKLDCFYYISVYREIKRMKPSNMKKILLEIYGTQIDWLNIMWIYRSKRFYNQTQTELEAATIPFTYRLKKEELHGMINASDLNELNKILENTGYFKGKEAYVQMENEISYRSVIEKMYQRVNRKYQVSAAPVLKYIYDKEKEIRRLTTIMEGIRYQLPNSDIKDLILITK